MSTRKEPVPLTTEQERLALGLLFDFTAEPDRRIEAINALAGTLDDGILECLVAGFLHAIRNCTNPLVFNSHDIPVLIALTRALGYMENPRVIPILAWAVKNQEGIINRKELERTGGTIQADEIENGWPEHLQRAIGAYEGVSGPDDFVFSNRKLLEYIHIDYERPLGGDPNPLPDLGYTGPRIYLSTEAVSDRKHAEMVDRHVRNIQAFEQMKQDGGSAGSGSEIVHRFDIIALESLKHQSVSRMNKGNLEFLNFIIGKNGQVTSSELDRLMVLASGRFKPPEKHPDGWSFDREELEQLSAQLESIGVEMKGVVPVEYLRQNDAAIRTVNGVVRNGGIVADFTKALLLAGLLESFRSQEGGGEALNGSQERTPPASEGCFIATAVYGTPDCPDLDLLRSFRDRVLLRSRAGTSFVRFYYRVSPPVARAIEKSPALKLIVRKLLVIPAVNLSKRFLDARY
jgi:hypothetical protein